MEIRTTVSLCGKFAVSYAKEWMVTTIRNVLVPCKMGREKVKRGVRRVLKTGCNKGVRKHGCERED